ncbi:uncharacterized protein LOC110183687 [Drosophila serrata]|uniref:uncharacterized protein LOC110183687 n=1 Tax=Drosophila serrata TaxID=7274 RepID=UPI000A1CFFE3|nr:uncharacterized protein LOC110183687 [Drosophila serrata]
MQSSNISSENSNNNQNLEIPTPTTSSINLNIPPFVAPRLDDVPIFGGGVSTSSGPRSFPFQLRSSRTFATGRVNRRRKYKVKLNLSRRILVLSNEARRNLLTAIADVLQIENSQSETSNGIQADRMSYNIELSMPNNDDSSQYAREEFYTNYPDLNNTLDGNRENNIPGSLSSLFNVFHNLFRRNSSTENQR